MNSTRCVIIQHDDNGEVTVDRFYDSRDMKWRDQTISAIGDAIAGLLLPRHNGMMAAIALEVAERLGDSPRISDDIAEAEEAFLSAANQLVGAWASHDDQYGNMGRTGA